MLHKSTYPTCYEWPNNTRVNKKRSNATTHTVTESDWRDCCNWESPAIVSLIPTRHCWFNVTFKLMNRYHLWGKQRTNDGTGYERQLINSKPKTTYSFKTDSLLRNDTLFKLADKLLAWLPQLPYNRPLPPYPQQYPFNVNSRLAILASYRYVTTRLTSVTLPWLNLGILLSYFHITLVVKLGVQPTSHIKVYSKPEFHLLLKTNGGQLIGMMLVFTQ